jgi:ATP-dependent exoDNAse (exonuclease V) beta subunit
MIDSIAIDSVQVPVDQQQRIDALNPLRSVCITAPAGSGKTELLSQRVLKLLSIAKQPEEILAITFTRKAAAEMHHRIIEALRFANDNDEPEQPHKRLSWGLARAALQQNETCGWQLLSNPNRLKIQTIDSLCSSLTRQMPILSNFGAQPQVSDQTEAYYRSAVHQLFEQLEQDSPYAEDLVVLLSHVDNDMQKAERLLMALLQKRDQWLMHIGFGQSPDQARSILENTLQQIIEDLLQQLSKKLLPLAPELLPMFDYAGCNLSWAHSESVITQLAGIIELPAANVASVEHWQAISDLFLTQSGTWRKRLDKNAGFPTETQDGDKKLAKSLKDKFLELLGALREDNQLLEKLQEVKCLPSAQYPSGQWELLESMTRLLPVLVAQLRFVFQQQGKVDYVEVSMAASQALGDGLNPTELAMKLDHQIRHILVDEFQDTASTQYRLLQRLVEGWSEYNAENPASPNTLFIVGDGMQSIYGFREANVGLFLEAKKYGINGVKLDDLRLTVNFRSDPVVVNWINDTFKQAFPAVENIARGAVPFESAQAFNAPDQISCVNVLGFTGDEARQQEAENIAALIAKKTKENPQESIAILVRSRGHLRDIIPALLRENLQWNARDVDPLANYSVIADLMSLTRALLNLGDRISWAALLRSPWIGLDNSDLYYLLGGEKQKQSVFSLLTSKVHSLQLSALGSQRLSQIGLIFSQAMRQRQRLNARSWIEGVWLALGGASTISSLAEHSLVEDFFNLLERYQQGEGYLLLAEFEQALLKLYAAPSEQESNLHIMTIHKAKGLEFDTVILPGLARQPRSDDKSLLMWREYLSSNNINGKQHVGLVISPLPATGEKEDPIYNYLRHEQGQSTSLENTRLLYVAATRAVKQLYLTFTSDMDSKTNEAKPPGKSSLIASAWDTITEQVKWHEQQVLATNEQIGIAFDEINQQEQLVRIDPQWVAPVMRLVNPLSEFYLDTQYLNDNENRPEIIVDSYAQDVGKVVHSLLQLLAEKNIDSMVKGVDNGEVFWQAMSSELKQQWLEGLLHYHGLIKSRWREAVTDIILAVDRVLNDDKGRWILSGEHRESYVEYELLMRSQSGIKRRIIDRCFIDAQGDAWIVDYKTATPLLDELPQDFIQREVEKYRSQLELYQKILLNHERFANVNTIRLALYFTHYPAFHEIVAAQ